MPLSIQLIALSSKYMLYKHCNQYVLTAGSLCIAESLQFGCHWYSCVFQTGFHLSAQGLPQKHQCFSIVVALQQLRNGASFPVQWGFLDRHKQGSGIPLVKSVLQVLRLARCFGREPEAFFFLKRKEGLLDALVHLLARMHNEHYISWDIVIIN